VWLAKTRLLLRGARINDSSVAREIQTLGFETHRSHTAVRAAVRRSLGRLDLLESSALPGSRGPIWPTFGKRELREELEFYSLQNLQLGCGK
jgi:hypothetical protein